MRCFKSFFKHTWHPQQMDTPIGTKFEPSKGEIRSAGETELGEVKSIGPTTSVATSTSVQPGNASCRNGGCKAWRSRFESRTESPWHVLKTIFLVSVIVALIVWVIVYTLLVQYEIL